MEGRYLIPKRLLKKNTIFDGIGGKELLFIAAGILVGFILFSISSRIFNNLIVNSVCFIVPPVFCWALVAPILQYRENIITVARRTMNFSSSKRTYYFSKPEDYIKRVSEILLAVFER